MLMFWNCSNAFYFPPKHLKTISASGRNEKQSPTVDGIKFATSTTWKKDNVTQQTKHEQATVSAPCPPSSMLACAWRSRCFEIYVSRLISPCDRFMQHNIKRKGQGELNKLSTNGLCACTDVETFIPSTISLNVVEDPWHMHLIT